MSNTPTQVAQPQAAPVTGAVGCPGPDKPCALCIACTLHGAPGQQLKPAVQRRMRFGSWQLWCEQRRPVEPAGLNADRALEAQAA